MSEELQGMEFLKKNAIKGMKCNMVKPFAFISYSHDEHDAQIVMNVFEKLSKKGYNLWIDTANMPVNEDSWKDSAREALRNPCCKLAVYFRSESSMIKETIAAELELIKNLEHIGPIITVDIWENQNYSADAYWKYVINKGSTMENRFCDKICDIVNKDNKAIRLASDLSNDVNRLVDEIAEELESKGVEALNGKTVSKMTGDTEPASAKKESKTRQAPSSKTTSPISNQGLPAGMVVYVKDHPQQEAQVLENGDVRYAGRDISLNQFVQLVLGPGNRNAYLYIVDKNTGKLLNELMNENGEEPEPEKEPAPKKNADPEPVVMSGKDVTIQEVREMCLEPVTLLDFKEVRNSMPRGGMSAMDYAMTAILGGCNQVTVKSPAYQINYYSYVISKIDDSSKKNDGGLGATWTWSSNCRKVLGFETSGAIPKEINDYFAELDNHTTLGELEAKFRAAAEEPFSTKKNDLVILAIQNIREFMNR